MARALRPGGTLRVLLRPGDEQAMTNAVRTHGGLSVTPSQRWLLARKEGREVGQPPGDVAPPIPTPVVGILTFPDDRAHIHRRISALLRTHGIASMCVHQRLSGLDEDFADPKLGLRRPPPDEVIARVRQHLEAATLETTLTVLVASSELVTLLGGMTGLMQVFDQSSDWRSRIYVLIENNITGPGVNNGDSNDQEFGNKAYVCAELDSMTATDTQMVVESN
jgi:hypothetical protein